MTTTAPNYDDITNLFQNNSAAEAHAMFVAFLCFEQSNGYHLWEQEINKLFEGQDVHPSIIKNPTVQTWLNATKASLLSDDFSFDLFLPADDYFQNRMNAFKEWCDGFLYATGILQPKLDEDLSEFINDMLDFSAIELEDETEENLLALEDLLSYVRMGVLLCISNHRSS